MKTCSCLVPNTPACAVFRNGGQRENIEEPPGPTLVASLLLGVGKPQKRRQECSVA